MSREARFTLGYFLSRLQGVDSTRGARIFLKTHFEIDVHEQHEVRTGSRSDRVVANRGCFLVSVGGQQIRTIDPQVECDPVATAPGSVFNDPQRKNFGYVLSCLSRRESPLFVNAQAVMYADVVDVAGCIR